MFAIRAERDQAHTDLLHRPRDGLRRRGGDPVRPQADDRGDRRQLLLDPPLPDLLRARAAGRGPATSTRSASAAAAGGSATRSPRRAARRSRSGSTTPTDELYELRDPGLLKLGFGADPKKLAAAQLEAHKKKLAELEAARNELGSPARPTERDSCSRPASATSASTSASGRSWLRARPASAPSP